MSEYTQIIAVAENQKEVVKFDFNGLQKNLERQFDGIEFIIRPSTKLTGATEIIAFHKSDLMNDSLLNLLEKVQNFANGWFAGKTIDDDIRYGGLDTVYDGPSNMDSN